MSAEKNWDTVLARAPPPATRPKKHDCNYQEAEPKFKPQTNEYAEIARRYEKYNNNNSAFNGKSLTDHRKITNYYKAKERGIDYVKPKGPLVK